MLTAWALNPLQWLFSSTRAALKNIAELRAAGAPLMAFGDVATDDTDGFHVGLTTVAVQAAKGIANVSCHSPLPPPPPRRRVAGSFACFLFTMHASKSAQAPAVHSSYSVL